MSRSGYSDDCGGWDLIRWRGAVVSSLRGARGQAFLKELLAQLDAMPDKRLTTHQLADADGDFCALGVVGQARGLDLATIDTEDWAQLASTFGISEAMAREIMFINDDEYPLWSERDKDQGPARWKQMRDWVAKQIKAEVAP